MIASQSSVRALYYIGRSSSTSDTIIASVKTEETSLYHEIKYLRNLESKYSKELFPPDWSIEGP